MLVAICLTFRLLARPEALTTSEGGLLEGTHPHPSIRSDFARVVAVEIACGEGAETNKDSWMSKLTVRSALDATRTWEGITGTGDPLRLLVFDDHVIGDGFDRVGRYMHQLLDCWHEVKPALEPFAMVPLALSKHDRASRA